MMAITTSSSMSVNPLTRIGPIHYPSYPQ